MSPGRKFSTTTSARMARSRAAPLPPAVDRSRTTDRLFLLSERKYAASSPRNGGPHRLVSSPLPGRSTFTTSAPRSARVMVASGPARTREKSTTRTPERGASMAVRPAGSSRWPDTGSPPTRASGATMEPPEPEGSSGSIAMYIPLPAVGSRVGPGEALEVGPAEIARDMGLPEPLAAARAVRALLARRRLEMVDGKYRLVDPRPIEPGEREQVPRPRRPRFTRQPPAEPGPSSRPTYSEIGHEAIERMIELGREVASLRAGLRTAREEARESREARDDAERRAQALASRVRDLEARAEMAESNLRTILAAARASGREIPVGDTEMEAILGVLKGDQERERSANA